jgi:hypothetical protein
MHKRKHINAEYHKNRRIENEELVREAERRSIQSEGYGVYHIIHHPTKSIYVGEGWLHHRKFSHYTALKGGYHTNRNLQRLFIKYPFTTNIFKNKDKWEWKVIKKWDYKNLKEGRELENSLIWEYKDSELVNCLNIRGSIPKKHTQRDWYHTPLGKITSDISVANRYVKRFTKLKRWDKVEKWERERDRLIEFRKEFKLKRKMEKHKY